MLVTSLGNRGLLLMAPLTKNSPAPFVLNKNRVLTSLGNAHRLHYENESNSGHAYGQGRKWNFTGILSETNYPSEQQGICMRFNSRTNNAAECPAQSMAYLTHLRPTARLLSPVLTVHPQCGTLKRYNICQINWNNHKKWTTICSCTVGLQNKLHASKKCILPTHTLFISGA